MTNFTYTEDFERRLSNAAKNGSTVCDAVLKALNKADNIRETVKLDYLTTVRINRGSGDDAYTFRGVKITCCKKDFNNANNPEKGSPVGMWRSENRVDLSLQDLVACFKDLNVSDFSDADYQYAAEVLIFDEPIVCVEKKGMDNITQTYDCANYAVVGGCDNTLWSSCMRDSSCAAVAGDFYANFCGANIIAAVGAVSGSVYGRAIYWPNITVNGESGPFLDRVYYVADPVRLMIWKFAEADGAVFRKYENSYSSKKRFVKFAQPRVQIIADVDIVVPSIKWHKYGSPYMDTFSFLRYNKDDGFVLTNNSDLTFVAQLDQTGTVGYRAAKICPVCGSVHGHSGALCRECEKTLLRDTPVGRIYIGVLDGAGNPVLPEKFAEAQKHLNSVCGC